MNIVLTLSLESTMTEDETLEWISEWLSDCKHLAAEHLHSEGGIEVKSVQIDEK